jgi:glycosyltransferase involved in cell wall biosynthesis
MVTCSSRAQEVHAAIGYRADKLHVIPNGFELDRFTPDTAARASVRAELGLAPDALLVGVVARFDAQKNHVGFVDAAAQVVEKMQVQVGVAMPQLHFVLAGKDVDASNATLAQAIAARGLQGHMHLLGRRDDVPRLMAAFDVLASPSHGEAFPNVLGEAMACGVPCVVTDAGDSADIVGNTGRVVAVGDMAGLARELVAVLQLPAHERAALGTQARARVEENYEIGHVTRLYENFYTRVLADDRKGAV